MNDNNLKKYGLKNTENRKIILGILESSPVMVNAEEIFREAKKRKDIDFSTVYRNLSVFCEKGIVIKSIGGDGTACYQLAKSSHSHYLICSECRKRVQIKGCPFEAMKANIVQETGFHITGHKVEFFGECPECFEKNKAEKGKKTHNKGGV